MPLNAIVDGLEVRELLNLVLAVQFELLDDLWLLKVVLLRLEDLDVEVGDVLNERVPND
jgi:hypothetical protein